MHNALIEKKQNYEKLGFKAGIEIHAQLSTKKKLFCHCPAILTQEKPKAIIQRKFRPVLGEMGVYDQALLNEFKKDHEIFYEVFDSICTYELDETPPFPINNNALYNCVKLAKMMNCNIVEETNVCRKNYLDGSVTCGFQQTALIGYDGYISLRGGSDENIEKKLPITWVYIEEEAARKDDKLSKGKNIYFKLDRLGIPLVEVVTHHNLTSPEEVVIAARTLGMIIKSSGLGRKGLGAIRQDINVSINEGARVELKGIQLLQLIPSAISIEINRQKKLVGIQKELQKRGLSPKDINYNVVDITEFFSSSKSKYMRTALQRKKKVFMLPVFGFKKLFDRELQPNKNLTTEISDRAKPFSSAKQLIYSNEHLEKYGISKKEKENLSRYYQNEDTAFILAIGEREEANKALFFAYERILAFFEGVPEETRRVDSDGISTFLRDLHGRSRLYPDTDLPPILIKPDKVKEIKENLPEFFLNRIQRMTEQYKISVNLAEELIYTGKADIFEILVNLGAPTRVIITTLTQTIIALSREGINLENINDQHLIEIFKGLTRNKFSKEAIPEIIKKISENPTKPLDIIVQEFDVGITEEKLTQIIEKILDSHEDLVIERGMRSFSPLMGLIMKEVRGKIDGKTISEKLRKILNERVSGKEYGENINA